MLAISQVSSSAPWTFPACCNCSNSGKYEQVQASVIAICTVTYVVRTNCGAFCEVCLFTIPELDTAPDCRARMGPQILTKQTLEYVLQTGPNLTPCSSGVVCLGPSEKIYNETGSASHSAYCTRLMCVSFVQEIDSGCNRCVYIAQISCTCPLSSVDPSQSHMQNSLTAVHPPHFQMI